MSTELTIVVPTYNEIENIDYCLKSISKLMAGVNWEIIFVDDDSIDGTSSHIREIARSDARVRCLQRLGRRGLSSACIEGILSSSSPYICVMDVDMQHDEKLIPEMLRLLKVDEFDIVIGSRKVEEGSMGDLPSYRVLISNIATALSNFLLRSPVMDPMSGYFMLRREFFEHTMHGLSGKGFKILLDILVTSKKQFRYKELPYVMRERLHGESKLDTAVALEFLTLIIDKAMGRIMPVRFILFLIVGLSGVFVHLAALSILHRFNQTGFLPAQIISTYIAMTSNYILNNYVTYREIKLKGLQFIRGLISFYLACTFGAVINIALADYLFELNITWWLAGITGATAGAIWNYFVTAILTWRVPSGTTN